MVRFRIRILQFGCRGSSSLTGLPCYGVDLTSDRSRLGAASVAWPSCVYAKKRFQRE